MLPAAVIDGCIVHCWVLDPTRACRMLG